MSSSDLEKNDIFISYLPQRHKIKYTIDKKLINIYSKKKRKI